MILVKLYGFKEKDYIEVLNKGREFFVACRHGIQGKSIGYCCEMNQNSFLIAKC